MKQLEMKFKWTKVFSHISNVRWDIYDFIITNIRNHSFLWVWFYWDDDTLWWQIYSQATRSEESTVEDLIYESAWNYIPIVWWFDDRPDLAETYMWQEELLYRWLTYLVEEDFIPKEF